MFYWLCPSIFWVSRLTVPGPGYHGLRETLIIYLPGDHGLKTKSKERGRDTNVYFSRFVDEGRSDLLCMEVRYFPVKLVLCGWSGLVSRPFRWYSLKVRWRPPSFKSAQRDPGIGRGDIRVGIGLGVKWFEGLRFVDNFKSSVRDSSRTKGYLTLNGVVECRTEVKRKNSKVSEPYGHTCYLVTVKFERDTGVSDTRNHVERHD